MRAGRQGGGWALLVIRSSGSKAVEKRWLTAVLNAVECASRWREEALIESASGWVERKKSSKNSLTETRAAVECAASVETKDLTNCSLTTESSNSCGCLWGKTGSQLIISITSNTREFESLFAIAEPSLGFSQNPSSIELKSLIMAQIERWRQA